MSGRSRALASRALASLALASCVVACAPGTPVLSLRAPDDVVVPPAEELPEPIAPRALPAELLASEEVRLVTDDDGRSPELVLEVPSTVAAVQIVASCAPGLSLILDEVTEPGGSTLVEPGPRVTASEPVRAAARGFPAGWLSTNRVVGARGLAAFSLPSTPDVALLSGSYRLRVRTAEVARTDGQWSATPVSSPVRVRAVGVPPRDGPVTLSLSLHATPSAGVNVEGDDAVLRAVLETATDAWAAADVDLAVTATRSLDDPALDVVSLDPTCTGGEIDAALEAVEPGLALPVVLVDSFECVQDGGGDVGAGIRGQAGGLPAPPWLSGTRRAGVVLAIGGMRDDARFAGGVLAHELGHALGLWHTQESGGADAPYDPIADTPDDAVSAEQNLMYHSVDDEHLLSDGQAWIARHSPWVTGG